MLNLSRGWFYALCVLMAVALLALIGVVAFVLWIGPPLWSAAPGPGPLTL